MKQQQNTRRNSGFTLVESVVSIALSSILLTVGVPSLDRLLAETRLSTASNNLLAHLHLARSVAIQHNTDAVLCPTVDKEHCLSRTDWSQGYMVFVDADGDGERGPQERLVHYHRTKVQVLGNSYWKKKVVYNSRGWAEYSNLTIALCDARQKAAPKAVIVSFTGRPRVDDEHPGDKPLTCPAA